MGICLRDFLLVRIGFVGIVPKVFIELFEGFGIGFGFGVEICGCEWS
jgi:hypothetical protein